MTLAGTGDDTRSVVKLGDSGVIDSDDSGSNDSGFSSPWVEHEEGQEVQRTHKDYLLSLKSPPKNRTLGKKVYFL